MNAADFVVRIVKAKNKPHLPKKKANPKKDSYFSKPLNILMGSAIGIVAGLSIYAMLKSFGVTFGGFESSLVIGLPAALGTVTSLVIF
jgi:hypothetical protein